MHVDWIKDLKEPEQREHFKKLLYGNEKVLDKLTQILYNYIKESETNTNDYDSPSWAYKAAHNNGRIEAFKKVIKLLDLGND
jgi:beta-lactamase class D